MHAHNSNRLLYIDTIIHSGKLFVNFKYELHLGLPLVFRHHSHI